MGEAVSLVLRLISRVVEKIDEFTREKLGDAFIEVGREVKRGDVVSDEEIDATKPHLDRTRDLQARARGEG